MKKLILPVVFIIIILSGSCASVIIEGREPEDFIPADSLLFIEISIDMYMDILGDTYINILKDMGMLNDKENSALPEQFTGSIQKVYAFSGISGPAITQEEFDSLNAIIIFEDQSLDVFMDLLEKDNGKITDQEYKGIPYKKSDDSFCLYFGDEWILMSMDEEAFLKSLDTALGKRNFFSDSPAMDYYNKVKPVEMFAALPDLAETIAQSPDMSQTPFNTVRAAYANVTTDDAMIYIDVSCEFASESSASAVNLLFNIGLNFIQSWMELPPELAATMELAGRIKISQDGNILNMNLPIEKAFLNELFYSFSETGMETEEKSDGSKKSGRKN